MAQSSGQFIGSIRNGYQQLIVQWTATQEISRNVSIITANMYFKSAGAIQVGPKDNTTTIDGIVKYYASPSISKSSSFNMLLGTVTQEIQHNDDGTKTFSMSSVFNIQATLGGVYYPNITATSGNIELPTIPRASSITVNDANIGSSTNIVINKASSNFTTTLYYKASGQNSWTTIVNKTANQVYGWTVPTSFYTLIPNSRTISCEFKAETYDGNTLIGTTTTTAIFTATGNPIIEGLVIHDMEQTTIDLTGNNTVLIKGYSDAEIEYEVIAQNGAGIKKVTVNNKTITYPSPQTTQIDMTDIANVTTNTFIFTVTDTRDYTTTETRTLQMIDYIPLTLNATIRRNTSTDGKINIAFNGNYFNDDFGVEGNTLQVVSNTLNVQYRYKESTSSTWGNWTNLTATIGQDTYSGSTQTSGFDYNKQYDFEIKAEDKLVTRTITGLRISKGEPVYWWDEDEFHLNSKLYYGSNGRQDYSDAGFEYDSYGNMKHRRSTNIDTWNIRNNSGTAKLIFNPETGLLNVIGNIQKNGSNVALASDVPTKTSDLTNDSIGIDFITVLNNAEQTIKGNNTNVKYNLNTVKASNGNKLTFDSTNHEVVVGSGVSYIEVSALIYLYTRGANSVVQAYIYKNNTQVARSGIAALGDYVSITIPPIIVSVQQNDKISVYIRSSAGNNTNVVFGGNNDGLEYLTVKVLK